MIRSRRWIGAIGLCLWLTGCPRPAQPPVAPSDEAPAKRPPLRVLVVDDHGLAVAVQQQWQARAEGELEVRESTSEQLLDPRRKRLNADAVVYPSGLIGELAARDLITPLGEQALKGPDFARRDIFDLLRQAEIVWGNRDYAVPLGSPMLTVLYRRDVLEKLELQPPDSWAEYGQLAARLSDRKLLGELAPADDAPWSGVVEPLGPGWASQVLLARAAVYARHRNYFSTLFDKDSMKPLIAEPPFVRALEELVAAAQHGPKEALSYTPADARRALVAGRCGMALAWPSHAETAAGAATDGKLVAVGVAELPPSAEVFHPVEAKWLRRETGENGHVPLLGVAGRLGSVVQGSAQPQAAVNFLIRVSSTEWSLQISPSSPDTTLYRTTQMPKASAWIDADVEPSVAEPYAELVRETQRRSLWLFSVRIPGRPRYLAALDEAVQRAIAGEKPASQCLQAAAEKWQAIIDELGRPAQKQAYWRSLGMEP